MEMAKRKKPGRPPKKAKKKEINSGFWKGVGAIILIVGGIVLGFGAFINAPIPQDFWDGAWWAFGVATIVAPFALIYLGALKFLSEDQQVPLPKMVGTIGLLVFLSSWLHTAFIHHDIDPSVWVGGHGGQVGMAVGDVLVSALGKFLASLVFFVLAIFFALFTFAINPRSLLKLAELFRREKPEGDGKEVEDLAALKGKMSSNFQLHEG